MLKNIVLVDWFYTVTPHWGFYNERDLQLVLNECNQTIAQYMIVFTCGVEN